MSSQDRTTEPISDEALAQVKLEIASLARYRQSSHNELTILGLIKRLEKAEHSKQNAIKAYYDQNAEFAEVCHVRDTLKAENERLREALSSVKISGMEIAEMAEAFISAQDVRSLERYGQNIASIARAALAQRGSAEREER